jgi:hypothetical protein
VIAGEIARERSSPMAKWSETNLGDGSTAWKCGACGLIVGGAPVTECPGRCPVCAARSGKVVAVVANERSQRGSLSMLVLDRRLIDLIEAYRVAKKEHEREAHAQQLINELGNYSIDDFGMGSDIEASASREQRSAYALADATLDSARISHVSRPSRPSHPS